MADSKIKQVKTYWNADRDREYIQVEVTFADGSSSVFGAPVEDKSHIQTMVERIVRRVEERLGALT